MMGNIDLASKIAEKLPSELTHFIHLAGEVAEQQGQHLYLVGGVVRDLMLGQANLDLDLVVEGNAIDLARQLGKLNDQCQVTTHPQFQTANLQWSRWRVDLTTARAESYAHPGALPTVQPGSIKDDLCRRDFTINAMAADLSPDRYGALLDYYGGVKDLQAKVIRVLHEKSFTDDATRILRGIRYEQRLSFRIEPDTLELLKRDTSLLDTISGDRIRHELELILDEACPEKALGRAAELGVLPKIHLSLKGNDWLKQKFEQARRLTAPNLPSVGLYLALCAYHLTGEEVEQLISHLRLPKTLAVTLRDSVAVRGKIKTLADAKIKPSLIYRRLDGYSLLALMTNLIASDDNTTRQHIQQFLSKLRHVKPVLTGNDLQAMGIASGPAIKEVLWLLQAARLDRQATTKRDEEQLVKDWLTSNQTPPSHS